MPPGKRVAFYARVSTLRQSEADLSIPDQVRQASDWCSRQGHELAFQYIESASGTDESRPVFSQMLRDAKMVPRTFDIVLVHSYSRFARDNLTYAVSKLSLNKAGIVLQSISQPLNADPTGEMVESILVAFDAYTSKEIAKHTSRAMKENAKQGFSNGSRPPFGYDVVEAERRGEKIKKRLAINETEAEIVKKIYDLYLGRHGVRYGVKAIAAKLNGEGITFRSKSFMISNVHRILSSETYVGRSYFNVKNSKSGEVRPRSEWIVVDVPAVISNDMWETVQARLAERAPRKTAPRIVNGPTLLTGLAVCAGCGAGMTLRTGKGYRYYSCARRAQRGPALCVGTTVSMPKADDAVVSALLDLVFQTDRLADLVSGYLERSSFEAQLKRKQVGQRKAELTETEGALGRLVAMVESGVMAADDTALADRLRKLKARREALKAEIRIGSAALPSQTPRLTEAKLFELSARVRMAFGAASPDLRKAYVRLFVGKVIISREQILVTGTQGVLARAAI